MMSKISGFLLLYSTSWSAIALAQDSAERHNEAPSTEQRAAAEDTAPAVQNLDFKMFKLSAREVKAIGIDGPTKEIKISDAIVQIFPNLRGSGEMCSPIFISKTKRPCDRDGELLVSFVKHVESNDSIPKRGECFCISKNALSAENLDNPKASLTPFETRDLSLANAYSTEHRGQIGLFGKNSMSPLWHDSNIFVRDPNNPSAARRYFTAPGDLILAINLDIEPLYNVSVGEGQRRSTKELHEKSEESPAWRHRDGRFRDPYLPVGIESEEYKKDEILKEYSYRSVQSLGTEHSPFATFHNAWKLSRLTRANNPITLKQINEIVKKQLDSRFGDPQITARLMPKYEAFNKYIWEAMHEKAQAMHRHAPDSEAVDGEFRSALESHAHSEMWDLIAAIENEANEVLAEMDPAKVPASISLDDARKINEHKLPPVYANAVMPSRDMCRRDFMTYSSPRCPCRPKSTTVPCNLNLPSLKLNFVAQKVTFGKGNTYQLVNEKTLPAGLRSSKFTARRTGYSRPNNSPAGTDKAGFAAIRRMNGGRDGKAVLGLGTLDSPITAAVSPAAAANFGVCQGDMLHDPDYGWLRVEGGCTTGGLGNRVDVWRGGVSTRSLNLDQLLNSDREYRHFPAGLIDADYAQKNPK
jgi:hypothetical protein